MKIDFASIIHDINDKPLTFQSPEGVEEDMTLRFAAVQALLGNYDDERGLTGPQKLSRWKLAQRIQKAADPLSVEAEDVVLIKNLVAKAFAVQACGSVLMMLDPET